jgi:NADPH:quinone reductase-like Zn-dependent oxidoreductase
MRAIVFNSFGGPEVLQIEDRPDPEPRAGEVTIAVKAFGVNRAETHMRAGHWPEAVPVSGIECVGEVVADPSGELAPGATVAAMMGGLGRVVDGSYAERTRVRRANVVPLDRRGLDWADLAAIPESYATAWETLIGSLRLARGETLVVRGATSALGQAAVNIAVHEGARVIATTRRADREAVLRDLGAQEVLIERLDLAPAVRSLTGEGADAVLDLVGNPVLADSLAMARRHGRVCQAGFLGGAAPIDGFSPFSHMPVAVEFSFFGSFMFGEAGLPLSRVPLQEIVDRVACGLYRAKPARVFAFAEIAQAHRLMESNEAGGKIVVVL